MRLAAVAMVLGVSSAASAEPAQQFDLVCTKQGSGAGRTNIRLYRIDLAAMRYCMDDCKVAHPIQAATADRITISESDPADRVSQDSHVIYRGTGQYAQTFQMRGSFTSTKGHCEPAPFSGLPAPKF